MSAPVCDNFRPKATPTRNWANVSGVISAKHAGEIVGSVSIVGRPNVGKSALFNRLVGRNIAIVHDQPGITRDRLASISMRGRRPFPVWDTGGIGGGGETELTTQVRLAACPRTSESAVILFLLDAP